MKFSGRTAAFQAAGPGSIPGVRTKTQKHAGGRVFVYTEGGNYFTASFRVFEARNFGTLIAFISIAAPVRGLRPMRPARVFASKIPKPATETSSPLLRHSVIFSITDSTARSASALVLPIVEATFSTKSILFAIYSAR